MALVKDWGQDTKKAKRVTLSYLQIPFNVCLVSKNSVSQIKMPLTDSCYFVALTYIALPMADSRPFCCMCE